MCACVFMYVCVGRGGRQSRAVLARDSRRRVRARTHRYAPRVIDGDQLLVSVNGVPVRGGGGGGGGERAMTSLLRRKSSLWSLKS